MSHHSTSVNDEGTSHKDPLSRILDELSSLKLWKEKQERKEKGKKRVEEISQDEREKIREEESFILGFESLHFLDLCPKGLV